jgi:hypothetical protein
VKELLRFLCFFVLLSIFCQNLLFYRKSTANANSKLTPPPPNLTCFCQKRAFLPPKRVILGGEAVILRFVSFGKILYLVVTGRYKKIETEETTMLQKLGSKLQVHIDQGLEKMKKVNFQHVIDDPSEEAILELGEILTELSAEDSYLDSAILTTQTRYVK